LQFHNQINLRIFDVLVEGSLVLNDFDIFRDAPGKNIPEVATSNVFVTDGTITIDFVNVTGDPSINGIEIIYTGGGVVPSAPTVIAPTKTPTKVPTKVPSVAPASPQTGNVLYRINSGSSSQVIVPPNNLVWDPDQFVVTGIPYDNCNSTAGSIYCSGRYFQTAFGTPFRYDLPVTVSNRTYEVRLHFAEPVRLLFVHSTTRAELAI
jgi:hypothetical protein